MNGNQEGLLTNLIGRRADDPKVVGLNIVKGKNFKIKNFSLFRLSPLQYSYHQRFAYNCFLILGLGVSSFDFAFWFILFPLYNVFKCLAW